MFTRSAYKWSLKFVLPAFLLMNTLPCSSATLRIKVLLTGRDCSRHLRGLDAINTVSDSTLIEFLVPRNTLPICANLLNKFGIRQRPNISCSELNEPALHKAYPSSYSQLFKDDSLLLETPIENISAVTTYCNLLSITSNSGTTKQISKTPLTSTDILFCETRTCIYLTDRTLNKVIVINKVDLQIMAQVDLDSLITSLAVNKRWISPRWLSAEGRKMVEAKPQITISHGHSHGDSLELVGTVLCVENPFDTIALDYAGFILNLTWPAKSSISFIDDFENPFDESHAILARSDFAKINGYYVFNIIGDSCGEKNSFFHNFKIRNGKLIDEGHVDPYLPSVHIGPDEDCYWLREVLFRSDYAMLLVYPMLMHVGHKENKDLSPLMATKGFKHVPIIDRGLFSVHDYIMINEQTLALAFRYDMTYYHAVIDIKRDSFISLVKLDTSGHSVCRIAYGLNGLVTVSDNGTLMQTH